MCCILYIPTGVATPTIDTLESVFLANRHGIGFADSDGNTIKTLSFARFTKAIQKRSIESPCIIHFRLATHGSISTKNCHPFYDPETDIWFAHNGVLPIETYDDMTDSEIFFREGFLNTLDSSHLGYDDPDLWRYVNEVRGTSRFVFMRGEDVRLLGDWHELDGVHYSNMNWAHGYRYAHYARNWR